jgi:hypothetical protein
MPDKMLRDFAPAPSLNNTASVYVDRGAGLTAESEKATPQQVVEAAQVTGGNYTPVATADANVDSTTTFSWRFIRVLNTVFASGRIDVDATAGGVLTRVGISLPVASNINGAAQLSGGAVVDTGAAMIPGRVIGDATNDRAILEFYADSGSSRQVQVWISYPVQ